MQYRHHLSNFALLAVLTWFVSGLAPTAHGQSSANPPGKMSYQGFLTDDTGVPLGNTTPINKDIVFRMFTAPTGGTIKWAEQQTVTLDKGFFTVQLGEGSGVGSDPFTNNLAGLFLGSDASDRYLEITVKGTTDITVTPRVQLLTSPYSFLARSATAIASSTGQHVLTTSGSSVGINLSGTPTATLDVNGTVKGTSFTGGGAGLTGISTDSLVDGSVTTAKINSNAVTTTKIADGSITSAKLATSAVGPNQIAANAVTASEIAAGAVGSSEIADGSVTATDLASTVGVWVKSGVNFMANADNDDAEVGINVSNPARPLHVASTTLSGANYICLRLDAAPRADYWDIGIDSDSGESGDDGDLVFLYKGTEVGWVDPSTSSAWVSSSDRRLKKDIEELPKTTLDKAMQIPVVTFHFLRQADDARKQLGVIAQDVQKVFPELVSERGAGMLGVEYAGLGVVGLAAIQELKTQKDAEINQLKTDNAVLKQQMLQMMERLSALEAKTQ